MTGRGRQYQRPRPVGNPRRRQLTAGSAGGLMQDRRGSLPHLQERVAPLM
jgi:hypothetical protein